MYTTSEFQMNKSDKFVTNPESETALFILITKYNLVLNFDRGISIFFLLSAAVQSSINQCQTGVKSNENCKVDFSWHIVRIRRRNCLQLFFQF